MARPNGAVAAGHPATVDAAEKLLREGASAVDACLAGLLTACVVEPVLASLGGGGFLVVAPDSGNPEVIDFFVHTPRQKKPIDEIEFHEVFAEFGTAQQAFHIGAGSVATPGLVAGIFAVHKRHGRAPIRDVFRPAIEAAQAGALVRPYDAYVMEVCRAVFCATDTCQRTYSSPGEPTQLAQAGDRLQLPELADTLESLAHEGPDLFYRGEIAALIDETLKEGGHLRREDLAAYAVRRHTPLSAALGPYDLRTNPPPSSGGLLLAFALSLLGELPVSDTELAKLQAVAWTMELTSEARLAALATGRVSGGLLEAPFVAAYRETLLNRSRALSGTTHVSVIDRNGGAASASVSNGEGAGIVVPGTGFVLNNMLGEEDINPGGFHRWRENERMTSMMAPTIGKTHDGHILSLGSGGSNRIRSALLQVLFRIIGENLELEEAIARPRIHLEPTTEGRGRLSVETVNGLDKDTLAPLLAEFPDYQLWESTNMFFGGVHAVLWDGDRTQAAGDPRRGGSAVVIGA